MKSGGKGGKPAHGVQRANFLTALSEGLNLVRNNVKDQTTTQSVSDAWRPHPVQPVSSEIKKVRQPVPWASRQGVSCMQNARRVQFRGAHSSGPPALRRGTDNSRPGDGQHAYGAQPR